ncbi:T-box transcription factor T-like isoform X2 [Daktulosphaira vitifoliae]|uniref:T-box transcription factor T-like isoform X2 n=1 Tax=Daktulosphaira vitifoliae TaxID=58002 RepID=UPI0021AA35DD|nr:T-box transcription factor T-like isoform X2 [Daktulosphaira vitifoliae]
MTSSELQNLTWVKGQPVRARLLDAQLWSEFLAINNEMIVTKTGRRMFPVIKVQVTGLSPSDMYTIFLEFVQVVGQRWKYINSEWSPTTTSDPATKNPFYKHPESPNFGKHWMEQPISFAKIKLTNRPDNPGQTHLNSLHQYETKLHIVRVGDPEDVQIFSMPQTRFMAVTAYQNEEVTKLKIKYNPFAKAFKDTKIKTEDKERKNHYEIYTPSTIPYENSFTQEYTAPPEEWLYQYSSQRDMTGRCQCTSCYFSKPQVGHNKIISAHNTEQIDNSYQTSTTYSWTQLGS